MAFQAQVLRILVASPSDLYEERQRLPDMVQRWNADHASAFGVVLLPVLWETHTTPEMGSRPQAIVNRQPVDDSDILIGLFWTRLGSPTGEAESGTVEEVQRFIRSGRPVMLYFSNRPATPSSIDSAQIAALRRFEDDCRGGGLVHSYSSIDDLATRLASNLTRIVRDRFIKVRNDAHESTMRIGVGVGAGAPEQLARAFRDAYESAGGETALGVPDRGVHAWGPGFVQNLIGGTAGESAIVALDGHAPVVLKGHIWLAFDAVSGGQGRTATQVGLPTKVTQDDSSGLTLHLRGGEQGPARLVQHGANHRWQLVLDHEKM